MSPPHISIMTNQRFRLSPEQFVAVMREKGWNNQTLAQYWGGKSPVYISRLAHNPNRPTHYDDAIMALPAYSYVGRAQKYREKIANAYLRQHQTKQKRSSTAYRYHDQLCVGAIVSVMEEVGSIADIGERGFVFQVSPHKERAGEDYGIIFEGGGYDWFGASFIDHHLVEIGVVDTSNDMYKFSDEDLLKADFASRKFNFHPEASS